MEVRLFQQILHPWGLSLSVLWKDHLFCTLFRSILSKLSTCPPFCSITHYRSTTPHRTLHQCFYSENKVEFIKNFQLSLIQKELKTFENHTDCLWLCPIILGKYISKIYSLNFPKIIYIIVCSRNHCCKRDFGRLTLVPFLPQPKTRAQRLVVGKRKESPLEQWKKFELRARPFGTNFDIAKLSKRYFSSISVKCVLPIAISICRLLPT